MTSFLIVWTGLSVALTADSPHLAVLINPWNDTAARRNLIVKITSLETKEEASMLVPLARELVATAPIDARSHSLLGEVYYLSGQPEAGLAATQTSLQLAQTDLIALTRQFVVSVQNGQTADAMISYDVLYRRWPKRARLMAPTVALLAQNEAGYKILRDRLASNREYQKDLLFWLGSDGKTSDLAFRLLLDLATQSAQVGNLKRTPEVERGIAQLVEQRKFELAHRLFFFTMNKQEQALSSYTFDSDIVQKPHNIPFFWQTRDTNATTLSYVAKGKSVSENDSEESFIKIDFLDKPVAWTGLQQYFRLAPGRYRLTLKSRAKQLTAPRGLAGNIVCLDPSNGLGSLPVPTNNADFEETTMDFSVPTGCTFARFMLSSARPSKSFQHRFSGRLDVGALRIVRLSADAT